MIELISKTSSKGKGYFLMVIKSSADDQYPLTIGAQEGLRLQAAIKSVGLATLVGKMSEFAQKGTVDLSGQSTTFLKVGGPYGPLFGFRTDPDDRLPFIKGGKNIQKLIGAFTDPVFGQCLADVIGDAKPSNFRGFPKKKKGGGGGTNPQADTDTDDAPLSSSVLDAIEKEVIAMPTPTVSPAPAPAGTADNELQIIRDRLIAYRDVLGEIVSEINDTIARVDRIAATPPPAPAKPTTEELFAAFQQFMAGNPAVKVA